MNRALSIIQKFFPNVKTVVDANRNAIIDVQAKDINTTKAKKHTECAMAAACKRKFKLDGVIISKSTAYLVKGNRARRFHVPSSVKSEIVAFDRGAAFSPGQYHLKSINPSAKLGPRTYNQKKNNTTGPKHTYHKTEDVRVSLGAKVKK